MPIRWIVTPTTPPEPVQTYYTAGDDYDQVFFNTVNTQIFFTQNYVRFFGDEHGYMRFPNINIPQGSTINSAFIRAVHFSDASGTRVMTLTGNDTDDAPQVSSNAQGNALVQTSASVTYNSPAGLEGTSFDTDDLSTIIQEIVDRSGWSSGNALAIEGWIVGSGIRWWSSYHNRASLDQIELHINYTAPA